MSLRGQTLSGQRQVKRLSVKMDRSDGRRGRLYQVMFPRSLPQVSPGGHLSLVTWTTVCTTDHHTGPCQESLSGFNLGFTPFSRRDGRLYSPS